MTCTPVSGSPALHSLPRAAYTVPPELRRLRAAWAWARQTNAAATQIAARCDAMTEVTPGPRCWALTARTHTGGGLCITINDASELVLLLVEDAPLRLTIPLPPHLRHSPEAIA